MSGANEPNNHELNQIINWYRSHGDYYTGIVREMSDKLFSWAFALNTGALAVTLTFMGASVKWGSTECKEIVLFLVLIAMFSLGILTIILAAQWEQERFSEKGDALDKGMKNLDEQKITYSQFLNLVPYKVKFYDKASPGAQVASYVLFFLGLVVGAVLIFIKA